MNKNKNKTHLIPMTKEKGWVDKGGYVGSIQTVDNSNKSFLTVVYLYFMTNNYFRNLLLYVFPTTILSCGLMYVFDNSNIPSKINIEGNIYNTLGEYAVLKVSCFYGSLIPAFFVGYSQLKYLYITKSSGGFIIGFVIINLFLIFIISYSFMYVANSNLIP